MGLDDPDVCRLFLCRLFSVASSLDVPPGTGHYRLAGA
jgi:hypothetical protein